MSSFQAGRLKHFVANWRNLTSDPVILDIVEHCHIELVDNFDHLKNRSLYQRNFSQTEEMVIENEISSLLEMKVIKEVKHEDGEVISPIFTVPKKNNEYRLILNVKALNKFVAYHHFKMDTFESTLKLVKKGDFMASVDLRHAYYSVPIADEQRKLFRFSWKGKVFEYTCLANGISSAPRLFTKLLKPVYATLRQSGHINSAYIDDSFLSSDSYEGCVKNVSDTSDLLEHVGFMINEKKSVLVPTTKIKFLGNLIDSEKMIVTLPEEKVLSIVKECRSLRNKDLITIRHLAQVLGRLVSSFSAVEFGSMHYRTLEREKSFALSINAGNFDALMVLSDKAKADLTWWIENLHLQKRDIEHGNPDIEIVTDSSSEGWGAVCNSVRIGGRWTDFEKKHHINYLEMLGAFYGMKSFLKDKSNLHVKLLSDNQCCVSHLRNKGGIKSILCNDLAVQIWEWCLQRNIWISAAHVPGKDNIADVCSRKFNENVEWMLNPHIFQDVVALWGRPDVDMFASRLNKQLEKFASWHPDPEASFIDAFSVDWSEGNLYMFPPFSLVTACLQKIVQDQADCVLVCPLWTTQIWWPVLMDLLIDYPRILPKKTDLLSLPATDKVHPLIKKLSLLACKLSGNPFKRDTFLQSLSTSSLVPGELVHRNSTPHILRDGFHSVNKGKLIPFKYL